MARLSRQPSTRRASERYTCPEACCYRALEIERRLDAAGLTKRDLAVAVGASRAMASMVISGDRDGERIRWRIAWRLGVGYKELWALRPVGDGNTVTGGMS